MARINARKLIKKFGKVVDTFAQGPAVLHKPSKQSDGEGGVTTTYSDMPCRAVRVDYEEKYRVSSGIPSTDVRVLVTRDGLSELVTLDHQVTVEGRRYRLIDPIRTDPINAVYDLQARPL